VRSAFATVPLYRELWAMEGRTEPVVVPGRTGVAGGAITPAVAVGKMVDLVPFAGGDATVDPRRGLVPVVVQVRKPRPGTLVVALDAGARPLAGLPSQVRGCVLDPQTLTAGDANGALTEVLHAWRGKDKVLAVGTEKDLRSLADILPEDAARWVDELPERHLEGLNGAAGVIHDQLLGYLGGRRRCGRWHLDWRRVYARQTSAGLAFTLLRQRSPRLVDVLLAGGAVEFCERHGTPVVVT